jgi:hypothetical protein
MGTIFDINCAQVASALFTVSDGISSPRSGVGVGRFPSRSEPQAATRVNVMAESAMKWCSTEGEKPLF